jgi:hypothetical protein
VDRQEAILGCTHNTHALLLCCVHMWLQDPALLELREQAIEGYRAGRGPRGERQAQQAAPLPWLLQCGCMLQCGCACTSSLGWLTGWLAGWQVARHFDASGLPTELLSCLQKHVVG